MLMASYAEECPLKPEDEKETENAFTELSLTNFSVSLLASLFSLLSKPATLIATPTASNIPFQRSPYAILGKQKSPVISMSVK